MPPLQQLGGIPNLDLYAHFCPPLTDSATQLTLHPHISHGERIQNMMRLSGLLASCSIAACLFLGATSTLRADDKIQIAVIPKGTTHEYWKSIHAGALKAKEELKATGTDVEIIWKGPLQESDSTSQISVVEDMLNVGVGGIVLAPNDSSALTDVVDEAAKKNTPVVIIDSDIKTDNYKSFVATDNHKGGELAAQQLIKLLNGKGRVIMLRYAVGSASTEKREQGFLDGIKDAKDIQLVSSDKYAGATTDSAYQSAENVLAGLKNPDGTLAIDGIFCSNESATHGMLLALEDIKATGKVKFVGFDASEALDAGLKSGEINALVIQDPVNMGYVGVMTMVNAIHNKPVDKRIDTGVHLATPDNMNTQEIHDLLYPPLDKYLK
jgi:ribose transport system substrate-binding protein